MPYSNVCIRINRDIRLHNDISNKNPEFVKDLILNKYNFEILYSDKIVAL